MKAKGYYILVLFLVLSGRMALYSNTPPARVVHPGAHSLVKNQQQHFENQDQFNLLIEDTDIDAEDEPYNSDPGKIAKYNSQTVSTTLAIGHWYDAYYLFLSTADPFNEQFQNDSEVSATNIPLYLAQRVLRIWCCPCSCCWKHKPLKGMPVYVRFCRITVAFSYSNHNPTS